MVTQQEGANRGGAWGIPRREQDHGLHETCGAQRGNGKLEWKDLFESAIKAAREGFVIGKRLSEIIAQAFNSFLEHAIA